MARKPGSPSAAAHALALLALAAGACSTAKTRITPRGGGEFAIEAESDSESSAYDAAVANATDYCQKRGRSFYMIEHKSEYSVAEGGGPAASSAADNKVQIAFKCR
jgi:hypothetical protein